MRIKFRQIKHITTQEMVGQISLLCTVVIMAIIPGRIIASPENSDERNRHHSIGMTGEITSNTTWQLETSYHWFPVTYIGVGASVGIWRQIGGDNIPATNDWRVSENSKNVTNVFFMPSLLLRTPALVKTEDINIGFMAEPGIMMNVPYDKVYIEKKNEAGIPVADTKISYNKGKWFAFNFRAGIYASFDNVNISLGYVCSNLEIYAMRRNMQYGNVNFKDFYPKQKYHGGMYIRISLLL